MAVAPRHFLCRRSPTKTTFETNVILLAVCCCYLCQFLIRDPLYFATTDRLAFMEKAMTNAFRAAIAQMGEEKRTEKKTEKFVAKTLALACVLDEPSNVDNFNLCGDNALGLADALKRQQSLVRNGNHACLCV